MPNDSGSFETFWNPGPSPGSPWDQLGDAIAYDTGGVLVPSTVTGGDKGSGTINTAALYIQGVQQGLASGVTPGTYGDSTHVGQFTVNALGIVTTASSVSISASAIGAVTSVSQGTGIVVGGTATAPTVSVDTTYLNTNYLQTAGGTMTGAIATTSFSPALVETNFGSSGTLKVLRLGTNASSRSVALGIDPATVAGAAASGNGQVVFPAGSAVAPNAAGTDWQGLFRANGGFVYVGPALTGGEVDTTKTLQIDSTGDIVAPGTVTGLGLVTVNYAEVGGIKLWNGTTAHASIVDTGSANQARLMDGAATTPSVTLDWATVGTFKIRNAAGSGDGNMSASAGAFSGTVSAPLGTFTAPTAGTSAGTFIGSMIQKNITDGLDALNFQISSGTKVGAIFANAGRLNIDSLNGMNLLPNTTAPAGGSISSSILVGNAGIPDYVALTFGTGSPTVNTPQGSMYLPRDGSLPWFKASGLVTGWVQLATSTGATAYVGTTAPVSPTVNQLWWKSDDGIMYIYYNDGNTTQWVPAAPAAVAKPANALQAFAQTGNFATAVTKIPLQTPAVNQNGTWDATNNRWTPPAGTYHVSGATFIQSTTTAVGLNCAVYKNGSPVAIAQNTAGTSGFAVSATVNVVVQANGTDYFELWGFSGVAQAITTTGTYLAAIGL
jgi:hypothetical protein